MQRLRRWPLRTEKGHPSERMEYTHRTLLHWLALPRCDRQGSHSAGNSAYVGCSDIDTPIAETTTQRSQHTEARASACKRILSNSGE